MQRCPAHTSHPPATSLLEARGDPNAKPAEQEIKTPLNSSRQGSQWAVFTQFHDVSLTSHTQGSQKLSPVFALTEYLYLDPCKSISCLLNSLGKEPPASGCCEKMTK